MLDKNDYIILGDIINEYEFIDKNGRLDLESFCVILATCMMHDQTGLNNQRPDYFHNLLIELIKQRSPDMLHGWVQQQKLADWSPKDANFYPTRYRTCIHISALIMHGDAWVSLIGSHILKIPDNECKPEYFGWIKEGWSLTYSFITAYHDALWKRVKQLDADSWSLDSESVSKIETLRLSMKEKIDYEVAENKLLIRNKAWAVAIERIKKAIDLDFCLEAISIEENIISNILFNWLADKKSIGDNLSFNNLIKKIINELKNSKDRVLFDDIDDWRNRRNVAIHNFVASSIENFESDQNKFQELSKHTAEEGLVIIEKLFEWYRIETMNFVEHRFPRNTMNS